MLIILSHPTPGGKKDFSNKPETLEKEPIFLLEVPLLAHDRLAILLSPI